MSIPKISMRRVFEVENEYGVNLFANEGKEDWIAKSNEMREYADKTATPLFLKFRGKKLSAQQNKKLQEVRSKFDKLNQEVIYERIKYYVQVYSWILGEDKTEDVELTREELEEFVIVYEKSMKQYFEIPSKEDDDLEPKKKEK